MLCFKLNRPEESEAVRSSDLPVYKKIGRLITAMLLSAGISPGPGDGPVPFTSFIVVTALDSIMFV